MTVVLTRRARVCNLDKLFFAEEGYHVSLEASYEATLIGFRFVPCSRHCWPNEL